MGSIPCWVQFHPLPKLFTCGGNLPQCGSTTSFNSSGNPSSIEAPDNNKSVVGENYIGAPIFPYNIT